MFDANGLFYLSFGSNVHLVSISGGVATSIEGCATCSSPTPTPTITPTRTTTPTVTPTRTITPSVTKTPSASPAVAGPTAFTFTDVLANSVIIDCTGFGDFGLVRTFVWTITTVNNCGSQTTTNATSDLLFLVNIGGGTFECDGGVIEYTIPTGFNTISDTYIKQNDCSGCFGDEASVIDFPASLTGGEC
jgi:hypothetical protein